MRHEQAIGAIVFGAVYIVACCYLAIYLRRWGAYDAALVTAALAYACYYAQLLNKTMTALVFSVASIVAGAIAGLLLVI